jgi:hypothetical protein
LFSAVAPRAAITPFPLDTPGLEVAAIRGLPEFTDARSSWFLPAAR